MILTLFGKGGLDISKTYNSIKQYNGVLKQSTETQLSFFDGIKEGSLSLNKYLTGLNGTEASLKGYIASSITARLQTMLLSVAYTALNVAITMGVSLAIQGLVTLIQKQINSTKDAIHTAHESIQVSKDEADALENHKQKIIELRTALDDGNLSQADANEKRTELMAIQDDLISKYGKEAEGINLVNDNLREQLGLIDDIKKANAEDWLASNYKAANEAQDYTSETINDEFSVSTDSSINLPFIHDKEELKNFEEISDEIGKIVESLGGKLSTFHDDSNRTWKEFSFSGTREEQRAFYQKLFEKVDKYSRSLELTDDSIINKFLDKISAHKSTYADDSVLTEAQKTLKQNALETLRAIYTSYYNDILDAQSDFNTAMASGDQKRIDEAAVKVKEAKDNAVKAVEKDPYSVDITAYLTGMVQAQADAIKRVDFKDLLVNNSGLKQAAESLKGLLVDSDIETWTDEQNNNLEKLRTSASDAGISFEDLLSILTDMGYLTQPVQALTHTTEQIEAQKGEVDKLFSSLKDLSSVMEQVNDGQEFSTVQILDIISKYPELIGHIEETANGYTIQKTALEDLMRAEIEELKVKARIKSEMAEANFLANGGSQNAIKKYSADIASGAITDYSRYASDVYINGLYDWMIAKADEIAYDKFTYDEFFGTGLKFGSKHSGSTKNEDPYKEEVESAINEYQYQRDMNLITDTEYYNKLEAKIKEKYLVDKNYLDDYHKYEVEIYKGRQRLAKDAAQEDEKRAEEKKQKEEQALKDAQTLIDKRLDSAADLFAVHQDENKYVAQLEDILKDVNLSEEQRLKILKEIADVRKNEYKDTLNDLEFTNELIARKDNTEQKQIDNLREMQEVVHTEADRLRSQGFDENSSEIQNLKRLWLGYEDDIQDILKGLNDKITQNLKKSLESQSDLLQEHIDSLQEEQENLEGSLTYINDLIDKQVSSLEAEKTALQENNDQVSRSIELTKLQNALENARRNKNVRVYDAAQGWTWQADSSKISEAKTNLSEWYRAENLRKEIENIDSRISAWQDYKNQWSDVAKNVELENSKIIATNLLGANLESDILNRRASAVEEFGSRYKAVLADIKTAQSELTAVQEQISNVENTSSASGNIAPPLSSFDSSTDYQGLINAILERKAKGENKTSNMDELAYLETLRNSKIFSMGLPYEQTSLYGGNHYARGTKDSGAAQFAFVGEEGMEGMFVPAHSTILPTNFTEGIWNAGANPVGFVTDNLMKSPVYSSIISNKNTNKGASIQIANITLPNVKNGADFITELQLYANTHE